MEKRSITTGIDLLKQLQDFRLKSREKNIYEHFYLRDNISNTAHIYIKIESIIQNFKRLGNMAVKRKQKPTFEIGIIHAVETFPEIPYLLENKERIYTKNSTSANARPLTNEDITEYSSHIERLNRGDDSIIDFTNKNQFWEQYSILFTVRIDGKKQLLQAIPKLKECLFKIIII